MRNEDDETALEGHTPSSDKLSIRWGLIFVDNQIAVPFELRKKLLNFFKFGENPLFQKRPKQSCSGGKDAERRQSEC